jgi:glycine/D-amino acid oxidase-like deaminating enzyme
MNRRDLLQRAILAAGSASALRCITASNTRARVLRSGVRVERDRIIRTVVGLRPYRRSGFVVRAEKLGDKLLIHNYGHGGCGVTLSWGTAHLALDLAFGWPGRRAAIIGSGAVGLATARLFQDHGFAVTIYAKSLPPETTSNIAGALWLPVTLVDHEHRAALKDQLERATRFAWRIYQNLLGDRYGVRFIDVDFLSDDRDPTLPREMDPAADLLPFPPLRDSPFPTRFARRMHTMLIEPAIYLPAVLADFRLAEGRVVVQAFENKDALLQLEESLIVNCTGLGARDLFGDEALEPIKGQLLVLMPQPEIDYATIGPGDLYMFARRDGIVLGGTHEENVWTLDVNEEEAERVLTGHQRLFAGTSLQFNR